ncbi:MAG: DUF6247 family protein [Dehalococcoidia bacterium]
MSTDPVVAGGAALPPRPLPGASPREIRAALRPEYLPEFDQDYQAALDEAGRSLDLAGVHAVLEHWRTRSWITRDPAEHRRLVRRASLLLTGTEPAAGESVAVTETRL